jgi:hypothetical protein
MIFMLVDDLVCVYSNSKFLGLYILPFELSLWKICTDIFAFRKYMSFLVCVCVCVIIESFRIIYSTF